MAHGEFYITRTSGSTYLSFLVAWTSYSNGSAANSSDLDVWVYVDKSGSSTAGTYGKVTTAVTVDGTSTLIETDLPVRVNPGGRVLLFAKRWSYIGHDAAGNRSVSIDVSVGGNIMGASGSSTATFDSIPRQATLLSAPDFNDEGNPTITYSNPAGNAVTDLRACISFTGAKDDIAYRSIERTGSSYTFNLTAEERAVLLQNTISSNSRTVYFFLATIIGDTIYRQSVGKTFTVVNCEPSLEPTVLDEGDVSYSATGDRNTLLRYFNYPKATFNSVARKGASIVSRTVTCGNETKNADDGDWVVFNNVSDNVFIFTVRDNRGNEVSRTVTKEMIDYVTPTCRSIITTDLSDNNTADIIIDAVGKYYEGSLGKIDNTLTVEYRYKTLNGTFSSWTQIANPTVTGDDYSARVIINDLDYKGTYVIQTRAKDAIYTDGTLAKDEIVKIVPVFDWGENDFNFNVPVHSKGGFTYDIPIHQGDVNAILTSGKYYMGTLATNKPGPNGYNGWLEVYTPVGGGDYSYQKFIAYTGEKYERWRNDGVWGEWILLNGWNDILISMKQSDAAFYQNDYVAKYKIDNDFVDIYISGTLYSIYAVPNNVVLFTMDGINAAFNRGFSFPIWNDTTETWTRFDINTSKEVACVNGTIGANHWLACNISTRIPITRYK